jgi:hypothetical protein
MPVAMPVEPFKMTCRYATIKVALAVGTEHYTTLFNLGHAPDRERERDL